MSNFPHSATIASSLSSSPFAVQSNLENLISRSRSHPHPRRYSENTERSPSISSQNLPHDSTRPPRRSSDYHHAAAFTPIPEASFDDGAAILLADDEDESDHDTNNERTNLLNNHSRRSSRRPSRGRNYGANATSEPIGQSSRRRSNDTSRTTGGNSRSRSKARTPPRNTPPVFSPDIAIEIEPSSPSDEDKSQILRRGRLTDSRPLSRSSSPLSSTHFAGGAGRRQSVTTRFADDSSGDEGGDVARGLLGSGAAGMLGGGRGIGTSGLGQGAIMEVDPAEELDAEDLELPVAEDGKEIRVWRQALKTEILVILKSAVPVFFTQTAEWSLVLASVISIGHLGTTPLAAASLSSMTASVSSFSILQGLATALDTLLPAAWTSSDPTRVGLWTQRMIVVMLGSMIPMFVLWWNIEGILLRLGQGAEVAALAQVYLRWLSIGIPGYGGTILLKKYLQAQNIMNIPTYVNFIVAPINLLMNYLLVWGPAPIRLGFRGGALATALSYNFIFILLAIYVMFFGPREAFHPFELKHVFSKLGTVTSLGLAGTIMLSSEWWAWEACALAASLLGPTSLAAQSVLLSTASTFFQVPASLGIASAVRCGNLLGAGRDYEAKWAARGSLYLGMSLATINSAILLIFRKNWGYLFNNDPEVVHIVARIMPWIALFQITDGVAATAGSVLRALGLHTTGALINLTSYYVIGLPIGLWLAFQPKFDLGLVGLWIGLTVALTYASVVSFVLVWRADWVRAVERVRERLGLGAKGVVGEDGKWEEEQEGLLGRRDREEEI